MIIFLYGEDSFRSDRKVKALKEEFFKKNTSNVNSSVFDFSEDCSSKELISSLSSRGLFSSEKFIVVKNLIDSKDKSSQDEIFDCIKDDNVSEDIQLLFWEKNEPRKNNKLFRFLDKKFRTEKFDKLSDNNLVEWVKGEFKKRNVSIENDALNKLIFFVGNDLRKMTNEVDKLSNYVSEGKLKKEDIEMVVKSNSEANIFETIEAVGSGNKDKALKLLEDQLSKGDDPFYIFSMYIYQFRNLLKIGSFYFDGVRDKNIISKETKLHPFVVQKGLGQMKNFSMQKLKSVYRIMEKLDFEIKIGKIGIEDALNRIIIKI